MAIIKAEIARRHDEHARGLMGRKLLPDSSGMLFIFGSERPLSFWMANTYIPLQIGFIGEDGTLRQIESMAPLSTRSIVSSRPCKYALEVNDGWFDKNNVKVGAKVEMPFMAPPQDQQPQQPEQVQENNLTIEQSFKDILKAVDESGSEVVVEYLPKGKEEGENTQSIFRTIKAPITFGDTADGDIGGLATVWDSSVARYTSLIIDDILSIKDKDGNPITSAEQVPA